MNNRIKQNITGYLFILPTLIGFIVFMAYPLIYSLFLSFMDWNMFKGLDGSKFIGIKNYIDAFHNEYFIVGLKNNITMTIIAVPILILTSLIIACILNKQIYARGCLRTIYFLPYITTITAAAIVFAALFHQEMGPVNYILKSFGIQNPPQWLGSTKWALPTLMLFWIWRNLGYCIIIFLSGLQNISKSYYEAASIDGAGPLLRFRYVTLPLISPTTFFLLITSIISSFQVLAEVKVMTDGGPGTATYTMVFHIYKEAFEHYNFGYASAVSLIFFFIILCITFIQWLGQKYWVNY